MSSSNEQEEREAFEVWWEIRQRKTFPKDYDESRFERWGANFKPIAKEGWQARAAHEKAKAAITPESATEVIATPPQPMTDAQAMDMILKHAIPSVKGAQPVAANGVTDAQRLDWLEQQGYSYGFEDMHEGNRWLIEGPYRTAREAIDAAISTPAAGKELPLAESGRRK